MQACGLAIDSKPVTGYFVGPGKVANATPIIAFTAIAAGMLGEKEMQ